MTSVIWAPTSRISWSLQPVLSSFRVAALARVAATTSALLPLATLTSSGRVAAPPRLRRCRLGDAAEEAVISQRPGLKRRPSRLQGKGDEDDQERQDGSFHGRHTL